MVFRGDRLVLAAAVFAALAVLAASQVSEEEIDAVKESMRQVMLRNPLYVSLPTENNCKNNTMGFILGSLGLLPWIDSNLGVALNKVADIDGASVLVDGQVVLDVIAAKNPPIPRPCCTYLCSLAKVGCACNDVMYSSLVQLVGGDETVGVNLINTLATGCMETHSDMNFEPTLKNTKQCTKEYESIAQTWTCPPN